MTKNDNRTVMERTTVPWNAAASIYQQLLYYYFLFELEEGECAGYEVKDDINVDYSKEKSTRLIQVKHTILTNKEGNPKNLTTKDYDLWHTINNWIEVVNDPKDSRSLENEQLSFIESVSFELYTNKVSKENEIFKEITHFKGGKIKLEDFRTTIDNLICKSENEFSSTDKCIQNLLRQSDQWLEAFLKKITIVTIDDLVRLIKKIISNKSYFILETDDIDKIYDSIHSELTSVIMNKSFEKKILIDYADFKNIISRCFSKHFKSREYLIIENDYRKVPKEIVENPVQQLFIQQLLDIEDIEEADAEEMYKYTTFRYAAENSQKRFFNREALLDLELAFEREKMTKWNNSFKKIYTRKIKKELENLEGQEREDYLIDLGNELLQDIRNKNLGIDGTLLETSISNGHFYWLSDKPEIGWRFDWKKYIKND